MDKGESGGLAWPPLIRGTLVKRYKRFLADVRLESGEMVTAHCPNSGSMKTCSRPGMPVYLSRHDNPRRKLKYTWELIRMPTSLVGINTAVPNRLVKQSIQEGLVDELAGYDSIRPEVRVGTGSRLDFKLTKMSGETCYVEVKNCTMVLEGVSEGLAAFPDAVTARGRKHLRELQALISQGHRCAMFFLIQRSDAHTFTTADGIDPAYGEELRRAADAGVEILVYDVVIDLKRIVLGRKIPYAPLISLPGY